MNTSLRIAAAGLVLAAATTAIWLPTPGGDVTPAGSGATPAAPDPPAAAGAAAAEVPELRGEAAAERRSHELELPDGTTVATLNDAVDAAPLAMYWGPMPWSPIVAIERSSAGVDWYRHADGSYSTTQMVWRKDLGRYAAMTRVAHPGPEPAPPATQGVAAAGRR
ncbi:MAG TPA: hypothetical protein VFZ65_08625 [Planctomycetota bacterium]|nr:hypothetical protein [Planctomycetota bacterium]